MSRLLQSAGQGIVIDFRPQKYFACGAAELIEAHGSRSQLEDRGQIFDLGHVLADEFLDCRIGAAGLYYDPDLEKFVSPAADRPQPEHALSTTIKVI